MLCHVISQIPLHWLVAHLLRTCCQVVGMPTSWHTNLLERQLVCNKSAASMSTGKLWENVRNEFWALQYYNTTPNLQQFQNILTCGSVVYWIFYWTDHISWSYSRLIIIIIIFRFVQRHTQSYRGAETWILLQKVLSGIAGAGLFQDRCISHYKTNKTQKSSWCTWIFTYMEITG